VSLNTTPIAADLLHRIRNPERVQRIEQIGLLTGLRFQDGTYKKPNFERGLILDWLVETRKPAQILELGTGRGLGAFAMSAAAETYGVTASILTLDYLASDFPQTWAIEREGKREVLTASRAEIWPKHLPESWRTRISERCGPTTKLLNKLLREGRKFDLIFIDAGHDLCSVVSDLAHGMKLLAPGGCILMDDFAPAASFGISTCIAYTHARRFFEIAEVIPSEGLVYGDQEIPGMPRNMVLLAKRKSEVSLRPWTLAFWKIAGKFVELAYRPDLFPARRSA